MYKYNHAVSLNITLDSNNEVPTSEELLKAFEDRIKQLNIDNIKSAVELFDSLNREEE